tara:strand:- start:454 stop:2577 length:2124 start_codon:yes stop_codon:yes gene_type:complete
MQNNSFQFIVFSLFILASFYSQYIAAAVCSFNGDTIISVTCEGGTISDANSSITINSGATLDVSGSRLTVDANIDITSIINNGTIKGGAMHSGAFKAYRNNNIGTFINNGSVNFNGFKGFWITNDPADSGNHGIFTNNGTWSSNGSRAFYNDSGTSWTSFTNSGSFTANGDRSFYLDGSGSIGTLTNSGTLTTDGTNATGINSFYLGSDYTITNFINSGTWALGTSGASLNGTITTLTNTGTISGTLKNSGTIATLTNQGTISETLNNSGTITTLTNQGTISGALNNSGTITTFNNGDVVAYQSALPANYNIIINNISDFGKLNVTSGSGSTTFNIHSSSLVSNDTLYKNITSGLSADNFLNTSGTYQGFSWKLRNVSGTNWDLIFGNPAPSSASTMTSIQNASYSLASIFSSFAMITNYANMNNDCGLFNQDDGCFSIGGRYNDVNGNNDSDTSSSALVAIRSFKINDNFRITGFVDQQVNINTPNGIKVDNEGPILGMSLVWNQRADRLDYQVKVGNAYQSKDIAIIRSATNDVTGDAISGRGNTKIRIKSHFAEVSYRFSDGIKTSHLLNFALRRAVIKQNGYTETEVHHPLTFNTLEDKCTTMILGIKSKYNLNDKFSFNGAIGVEHDVSSDVNTIQASSSTIAGLTPVELNTSINKTRPVATLGITYHISPNQSFSAQTEYQELSYFSTSVNTAYLQYNFRF